LAAASAVVSFLLLPGAYSGSSGCNPRLQSVYFLPILMIDRTPAFFFQKRRIGTMSSVVLPLPSW
jgi:hypothetical protein